MKVILATETPRCAQLLNTAGIECDIVNPNMDETLVTGKRLPPTEVARALAAQKAVTVFKYYPNNMVLGVDTIVCVEGELLGFPKNREDAKRMLMKLSGKTHEVYTGVHLVSDYIEITFSTRTMVEMTAFTEQEAEKYLDSTEEYLKCPGAYEITGGSGIFVERINGDLNNCLGLPICELRRKLREHGMRV